MTEVGQRLARVNELLTILFREADHAKRMVYLKELQWCYEWLAEECAKCARTEQQIQLEKAGLATPPEVDTRPHILLFARDFWNG